MRRPGARPLLLAGLLAALALPPAAATPLFADGFEACCTVGGTVAGLDGRSTTLRVTAGALSEDLAISSDGPFRFDAVIDAGVNYSVSVLTQPGSGPDCTLSNGSGVMPAIPINHINVSCGGDLIWDSGAWGDDWQ